MKKRLCVVVVIALAAVLLAGCGMILVEDAETVRIGAQIRTED